MRRGMGCGVAVMLALTVATGCGGDSADSGDPATSGGGGNSAATEPVAGVPTLDELYQGSYTQPPPSSPPGAKGKSVWWISCSQAVPSCVRPAEAAAEAAKALGIDFHVADGKFNVGGAFSAAIRTALAAKPDAILLYGVACEAVRGALQDAKAQGVLVMGVETPDCATGEKMFSVNMKYSTKFEGVVDYWHAYGATAADYIIAKSGGKAKIINNAGESEPLQKYVDEGFREELKKCPGCEIVETVPYSSPDLVPNGPWIQAFRSALVKHPDATAAYMPWEVMWSIGGAQAITESGLKLISFGGQAAPDGLDLVRQGKITAITTARSMEWSGYAGIDSINRALNDEETVVQGIGFALVDKTKGLPAQGAEYKPPIDFKAAYQKAWGASAD
jgi:ribose transport system substrate-binding protein